MQAAAAKLEIRDVLGRHIRPHGNEKVAAIDTIMLLVFNIARGRQPLYELAGWVRSLDPTSVRSTLLLPQGLARPMAEIYALQWQILL